MSSSAPRACLVRGALALALVHCDAAPLEVSPDASNPPPMVCEPERGLLRAADVLSAPEDPCHGWLRALVGRAVRVQGGSGSIWTRATPAGTGLLTTAGHVLSRCSGEEAPLDANGDCLERVAEPRNGQNLLRLTDANGEYRSWWTPAFALYNSFVPAAELHSPEILPEHEASVYAVDATSYEPWEYADITPEPRHELLPIDDPTQATTSSPTWAEVTADTRVIVMGYPFDENREQHTLVASVGRVLAAQQVDLAQQELAARDDEEGSVPYAAQVEFFFRGHAVLGMSGAGVFDEQHRQVGVVVRGSTPHDGVQYVRALRMSHVAEKLAAAVASLSAEQRAAVLPFVEAP